MEADWEFEIGPGAPIIDADWPGLVDLQRNPRRVDEIIETGQVAGLTQILLKLNGPASPLWTSKCDVWQPESADPDEMDASSEESAFALACYIDLLSREVADWATYHHVEAFCRSIIQSLRQYAARCCRADLIVRQAIVPGGRHTLGATVYLTGCGTGEREAAGALTTALAAFEDAVAAIFRDGRRN